MRWVDAGGHYFNRLNAQLNPICLLLALLGAHHIFHVSRIRIKNVRKAGILECETRMGGEENISEY
jgi:hypothetical protein